MTVLALVLAAADMDPVVASVRGFHDELVEVGVLDDPVEPSVEDVFIGMGFAIAPFGIGSLWYLDVGL